MEEGQGPRGTGLLRAARLLGRGSPFCTPVAGISLGPEATAPLLLQHKWTGFWFLSKGPRCPTDSH